jgi:Spy/CpxP family protein refolding chaperone
MRSSWQTRRAIEIGSLAMVLALSACAQGPSPTGYDRARATLSGMEGRTARAVADPDRSREMIALISRLADLTSQLERAQLEHRESLRILNADYDADRAQFEAEIGAYELERVRIREEMLETRVLLTDLADGDEWEAIVQAEAAGIESGVNR